MRFDLTQTNLSGQTSVVALGYHWNSSSLAFEVNTGGTTAGTDVTVTNFPASYAVTGTFWQTTQPVDLTKIGGAAVGADNGLYIRPGTGVSFAAAPASTWVSGALTLTDAATAYKIPASEQASRTVLILYNGSDTDMYVGSSAVTTSTGILLATGATMTLDAGSGLYAICASAGKILRYLEGK